MAPVTVFKTPVTGITILGPVKTSWKAETLSVEALKFVAFLHRTFSDRRKELLCKRIARQKEVDRGLLPDFLPETAHIHQDNSWRGAPPAPGLLDRHVERTGPVDRKMIINALNSGACTYMADIEDPNSPTWENCLQGQVNLQGAVRQTIEYTDLFNGKIYHLRTDGEIATSIVRPRGWHMVEKHVVIDGEPVSASIFDFAIFFYHNAHELIRRGQSTLIFICQRWNHVWKPAFEMEEIIYELREHSAGLTYGRWDYIFSFIKCFRQHPRFGLPDRNQLTMTVPFMDAYVRLLIETCHRRGVHAIGGTTAQIPIKNNPEANAAAMAKVHADQLREVNAGHDGSWYAHPELIQVGRPLSTRPHQLDVLREDVNVQQADLLNVNVDGIITEHGIRSNIHVALQYMEALLRGKGCVPIHHLMEDAAIAEVSRSQLWQWTNHQAARQNGRKITSDYLLQVLDEELDKIKRSMDGDKYQRFKYPRAAEALATTITVDQYVAFLTTLLYDDIVTIVHTTVKMNGYHHHLHVESKK